MARGARSLGQHSVYGFANSTSLFTSNVARALGKASFDRHYQANRELTQVLHRPANPLQGVAAGGAAFTRSLEAAVKGVVDVCLTHTRMILMILRLCPFVHMTLTLKHQVPRSQMRRKGGRMKAAKVIGGVGAGFLGLIVKPLAGAFDMLSLCSEGVKNYTVPFANSSDARKRVRSLFYSLRA